MAGARRVGTRRANPIELTGAALLEASKGALASGRDASELSVSASAGAAEDGALSGVPPVHVVHPAIARSASRNA
jgi:hypothetical protein